MPYAEWLRSGRPTKEECDAFMAGLWAWDIKGHGLTSQQIHAKVKEETRRWMGVR